MPNLVDGCRPMKFRVLAAWTLLLAIPPAVQAQEQPAYETLPHDPNVSQFRALIVRILAGDDSLAGNEEKFDRFFVAMLGQMSRPDAPGNFARERQNYLIRYRSTKTQEVLRRLNRLTLEHAQKIVVGNYHPAARFNAALLIGDLDQQLAVDGVNRAPPVPLAEVFPLLMKWYAQPDFPDQLHVAALIGLKRFALYSRPEEGQAGGNQALAELRSSMLHLLAERSPPAGRNEDTHLWLRRLAAEILGALGDAGREGEVWNALLAVLQEGEIPYEYRCPLADSLGHLRSAEGAPLDVRKAIQVLGCLAQQVCVYEQTLSMGKNPPSRQRLAYYLANIQAGLKGCETLAKEPEKKMVAETLRRLEAVLTVVHNPKSEGKVLASLLPGLCRQITPPFPCDTTLENPKQPAGEPVEKQPEGAPDPFG